MAFEITEHNVAVLKPLFKPWEEPLRHRRPNPVTGQPALVHPGRQPSKVPVVRAIRAEVDGWRRGGYAGVSDPSRFLLMYWFNTEHQITDGEGNTIPFRYHWAQREAIETIIYLYCSKIATGGGKTKVMSLAIVWSYYHCLYEANSNLTPHIPSRMQVCTEYFSPDITSVSPRERSLLEKNQRYLEQNLVYGRSIQKLGTLLFCLDHAQKGGANAPGVWRDVQKQFSGKAMAALYTDLRQVNDFRNTRIAHVETKLDDADEAWQAMIIWLRCIAKMAALAS